MNQICLHSVLNQKINQGNVVVDYFYVLKMLYLNFKNVILAKFTLNHTFCSIKKKCFTHFYSIINVNSSSLHVNITGHEICLVCHFKWTLYPPLTYIYI